MACSERSTVTTDDLRAAIRRAQEGWTGADWTHEWSGESGEHDGEYCDGDLEGCDVCARAEDAAAEASAHGHTALVQLGQLEDGERDDWGTVVRVLGMAAAEERRYGDDPTWRPVVLLAEQLAEHATAAARLTTDEIRALRDEAVAAGDMVMAAICDRAGDLGANHCDLLSAEDLARVQAMSEGEARAECARVIAEAQG